MKQMLKNNAGSMLEPGLVVLLHLALVALVLSSHQAPGDHLASAPIMAELIQPDLVAEQVQWAPAKPTRALPEKQQPVLSTKAPAPVAVAPEPVRERAPEKPLEPVVQKTPDSTPAQEPLQQARTAAMNVNAQTASARVQAVQVAMGGSQNQQHSYLAELMRKLSRHKVYPADLKRDKVEGKVVLKFTIAADGQVVFADVQGTSGSLELDSAAMSMLKRASPLPAIPGWMNRTELTLSIPVEYSLITDR